MLGDSINVISENDMEAEVVFTINNKSEIVIVSVNSENYNFDGYIKNKLNYKKVKVSAHIEGEIYRMPLKIVHK